MGLKPFSNTWHIPCSWHIMVCCEKHPILATLYKNTVTELEKWLPELTNYPKEQDWGYLVGKYEEILTDATKKWGEFRLNNN